MPPTSSPEGPRMRTKRPYTKPVPLLAFVALSSVAPVGCGAPSAIDAAMDRETFIATYVELRAAALSSPSGTIDPGQRDSILTLHGAFEADLLEFAELHGGDPEFMNLLWTEVQTRLLAFLSAAESDAR